MRIIGIDPGLQSLGWGVISATAGDSATWRTGSAAPTVRPRSPSDCSTCTAS